MNLAQEKQISRSNKEYICKLSRRKLRAHFLHMLYVLHYQNNEPSAHYNFLWVGRETVEGNIIIFITLKIQSREFQTLKIKTTPEFSRALSLQ